MSGLGKKEEFVCLNSIAFSQILQYVFCQEKTNKQRKQETGRVAWLYSDNKNNIFDMHIHWDTIIS